jgi:ABC-type uncharacterized transport system ATPase subunit
MPSKSELIFHKVHKAFGDCIANDEVSFSVEQGTIHAIVGENGAGKSTAMKILYGEYPQDKGTITFRGKEIRWNSSKQAIASGIGMVHQHFMLAETHTALENILLGTHTTFFSPHIRQDAEVRVEKIMAEFGLQIPLHLPVGELPVGEQQQIEILKLLYRDSDLFILDEPTAVLTPREISRFFDILRKMQAKGKTILIITHKLKEVMTIASRVTIFRAGKTITDLNIQETSIEQISDFMIGRKTKDFSQLARPKAGETILLEGRNLQAKRKNSRLKEVSFRLREGEILGIAGVEGNGQSDLVRILTNPKEELAAGDLFYRSEVVNSFSNRNMRERQTAYFPEDRLKEALLLNFSMVENYVLGREGLPPYRRGPLLSWRVGREKTKQAIQEFGIRPETETTLSKDMSGGNQQKLVVARELQDHPRVLISSQPTRGVDVGAIEFIHEKLLELRAKGTGVLLVSSELEELLKLSDRILVMFRGRVVGSFLREEFAEKKIGALMAGANGAKISAEGPTG